MNKFILLFGVVSLALVTAYGQSSVPAFKKLQLTDQFYAEGAYYADFNKDGKLDVVSGPFWYEGPDFTKKHEVRPPKAFDPKGYSDNFLTYTGDFNGDGWADIIYCPWPGKKGFWYENPAGKDQPWKEHAVFEPIDNESPMWGDVNSDGKPELLFNANGCLGFLTYDTAKPDELWVFHAITPQRKYHKYTHGIGFGDINGDGRNDIIEGGGWWEQPVNPKTGEPWIEHPFKFADAACQMYVYDVDGDGLKDVITSWHCHKYGLLWWKQVKSSQGEITWKENVILPSNPDMNSKDLRISQLHAIDLADFNSDGLLDILIGKRFWAHGPKGDVEPDASAVVYWFELQRKADKSVQFVPHMIDDNSGVGTQVAAADLNGDGIPDVITANKKCSCVFLSQKAK
ncbi:MAG: VCBS repeat-containing protein [Kiritimatiellae bacterium]|nr:VCBS repeat-containing protein [Kiritimatiellia bacterium]